MFLRKHLKLFLEFEEYLQSAEEKVIEVLKACLPAALRKLAKKEIETARQAIEELRGCVKVMPLFQNLRKIREELIFEGLQQGLQQGIQQGLQQGIQQGFEQGKIETAEKMIMKGYSD